MTFLLHTGNSHSHEEIREIQRQNKITAQILENFLERRLFPNKRPTHKLPTLDEILAKQATEPPPRLVQKPKVTPNAANNNEQEQDDDQDVDPESLQSVESEHVDSYYDDYTAYKNGGRSLGVFYLTN